MVLDVREGFVRVCLDEVRRFDVARVVAVEVVMALGSGRLLARGELSQWSKFFSWRTAPLEKSEMVE